MFIVVDLVSPDFENSFDQTMSLEYTSDLNIYDISLYVDVLVNIEITLTEGPVVI
uniref:Uncharacterized protein n=1 Tax=Arion vulgaris TaxID=1028688 RepID=A0A0B6ZGA3_9EUPU